MTIATQKIPAGLFAALEGKEGNYPAAEESARTSLALPVYPELTPEQKQYVVNCIRRFYEIPA